MVAGPGKASSLTLQSGIGRIRGGTIAIGDHVIAIDNIGTLSIVKPRRAWWLVIIGILLAAGAATQLTTYGAFAISGIGFGAALIIGGPIQYGLGGLSIGASDGCITLIASRDQIFVQRLLHVLKDRIDTGDQTLAADFDIARATLTTPGADGSPGEDLFFSSHGRTQPASSAASTRRVDDGADDPLFTDPAPLKTETAPVPQIAPEPQPSRARSAASEKRRQPYDRLLDGDGNPGSDNDDWLAPSGGATAQRRASEGGAARVLLGVLVLAALGGGVFATWYFTGETGPSSSLSAMDIPPETTVAAAADATPPAQTADTVQLPLVASVDAVPPPSTEPPSTQQDVVALPAPTPIAEPEPEARATAGAEIEDFTPPAPIVTRSSGQPYRSRPSAASDVSIVAQTRAGGEVLNINGQLRQPDGDWYRVTLADGQTAWFKASLAVPRALFSETIAPAGSSPEASFAASAPLILGPAEGAQFFGGPQPVRLAWSHRGDASIFIVEIQGFNRETQRWIEDPLHKRATVQGESELVEMISAGGWRWRVRGVTTDGQQSLFSRWSAFSLRD